MKCPYCGNEVSENLLFCPFCGEKIQKTEKLKQSDIVIEKDLYERNTDNSRTNKQATKKKHKFINLLQISVVIVIAITAFISGRMSKNSAVTNQPALEDTALQVSEKEEIKTQSAVAEETPEVVKEETIDDGTKTKDLEKGSVTWEGITFSIQRTDETTALLTIESKNPSDMYYFGPHMEYNSPVVLSLSDGSEIKTTIDKNLFWQQNNYNEQFVSGTNVTMVLKFDDSAAASWDSVHICVTSLSMMLNNEDIVIDVK